MKTIFVLYMSLNGPTYDYDPLLSFYKLDICERAAESLMQSLPDHHAYCAREQIITQPDGSVRPVTRP
jgi:hypothetical protein